MMQKPVWLLSMDSDQFPAAPMTTGGLKAYYQRFGSNAHNTDLQLVHFVNKPESIPAWLTGWLANELPRAQAAIEAGITPIMGFSVYTWNAAEFLALMREIKAACPALVIRRPWRENSPLAEVLSWATSPLVEMAVKIATPKSPSPNFMAAYLL